MQKPKYVMNCRIMSSTDSTIIIIPARMAASRLPGKPLADIAGKPMIQHVWERARAADIAPVYVATDDPAIPAALAAALDRSDADVATLVTPATAEEAARPQVVKAAIAWDTSAEQATANASRFGRALYFSRAPIPANATEYNHHVGVYGWRRSALAAFVTLPPSPLELTEKLEQLRALEAGMTIAVAQISAAPGGVDTNDDLTAAASILILPRNKGQAG